MDGFWAFAGDNWWLIFPAFGLLSAASGSWASASKRRHKQRLEVMKAKAELAAARSAAKHGIGASAAVEAAGAPARSFSTQADDLRTVHDDVTKRWLDYELDVAKLIAFPSMSDGREPLTAAFLRAKKVADRARPADGEAPTAEQIADYRAAVTDFEVAFDLAERDARRVRDSGFSTAERKRLATASRLLAVATDTAATPAERHLAYERVREEIDGLIALSDDAVELLEKQVARELPASAPRRDPLTPPDA